MTRLTTDMAREIVQNVIDRREGELMPKSKKSAEEEIDDLVDDLDELEEDEDLVDEDAEDEVEEDDDEADDEDDDEDEDPDEAPKAKKSKSKKAKTTKKAAPKKERTGVGTVEVAAEAGIEPRQLRAYLRNRKVQPRDDREGRYEWPSLKDKEVQAILKDIRKGAVTKLNKERIADLKDKKASASESTKKKSKKKAKASK